ncbi:hypothetical protein AB1046_02000 [Promicromonospora sp. Populi]|uniref:hypothetical protein n=1 Tax=Promicromonospora sp. Populi TaxID=3239420 RepID=UPI0034E2E419
MVAQYLEFTRRHGIEVAGIENIRTADGRVLTYGVNTNTNYNSDVEQRTAKSGPREIVRHLARVLKETYPEAR